MINPRNARRGYRERVARRARTSPERQKVFSSPQRSEKKMNTELRKLFVAMIVSLTILCTVCCIVVAGIKYFRPETTVESTVAPINTEMPKSTPEVVATPAATVEVHKPAQLQTVKVNGVEYGTDFDNRIAFTNGEILTGHTAPYDDTELSLIQTTWVEYTIEMPANAAFPVAFGFSVNLEENVSYSPGAIILLPVDQGVVKVKVLDGEIVLWRDLSAMHRDISDRISTEIANGNLSIDRPLAFSFCSQEFSSYVPRELLDARKVTIVK